IKDKRLLYEIKVFLFYRPFIINNYFNREHLKEIKESEKRNLILYSYLKCKKERIKLKNLNHFKAYIINVYDVKLRRSD
ncbi:hypothetical protein QBC46DRAFT_274839, partial [Diplogelasinospora grovesii]